MSFVLLALFAKAWSSLTKLITIGLDVGLFFLASASDKSFNMVLQKENMHSSLVFLFLRKVIIVAVQQGPSLCFYF